MKQKITAILLMLCLALSLALAGCGSEGGTETTAAATGGAQFLDSDKDFSSLRTPGSQEAAYDYNIFFQPEEDGGAQPYVGDTMPYYEDGTYYIYYLKESGDSYNHSVYLATTTDFLSYQEYDAPILEASRSAAQDAWIGTGSVVKVGGEYLFFYTGHTTSDAFEYKEKILLAKGSSLTSFEKVEGWEIVPPSSLGQKNDFRDPQAYYDADTDSIVLTVTAAQQGSARILKYTLSSDLSEVTYDGIILTDPTGSFWNLECSDTFQIGSRWYITYSAQDDTLWYASSDSQYGPYDKPQRLEGKLFYAGKHVENGTDSYLVGWARRSESPSSTQDVSGWAGNLMVQQLGQAEDGSLYLMPPKSVLDAFTVQRPLVLEGTDCTVEAGSRYSYSEAFTAYERFVITGKFTCTGTGSFGLAFDFNNRQDKYKLISLDPDADTMTLSFNEGSTDIAQTSVVLDPGQTYSFTYLQEGSVGVFYIDGVAALTVRLYGVSGKPIRLFAENNSVTFSELNEYTN